MECLNYIFLVEISKSLQCVKTPDQQAARGSPAYVDF